jgi:hypothetical protein
MREFAVTVFAAREWRNIRISMAAKEMVGAFAHNSLNLMDLPLELEVRGVYVLAPKCSALKSKQVRQQYQHSLLFEVIYFPETDVYS